MKTGIAIVAGLLAGVLVAAGVLAALVFVGPDPVGLRPTPLPTPSLSAPASPSVVPASSGPSASFVASGPPASSGPSASFVASGSPAP